MTEEALSDLGGRAAGARSFWTPVAAALSAVAASLCCILPVLAAVGGIGSAALGSAFEPYRPWFIGLTVLLLGWGYYQAFVRSRAVECADGTCRVPASVKVQRWLLVAATAVSAAAISVPWWVEYVFG